MARVVIVCIVTALVLAATMAGTAPQAPALDAEWMPAAVTVGIHWLDGAQPATVDSLLGRFGGQDLGYIDQIGVSLLSLHGDLEEIAMAGALPGVLDVAEDSPATVAATVNDPDFPAMAYLEAIGVPAAWEVSRGEGVTLAIVDSGIDTSHPDLVDRLVPGYDFVDNDSDPTDPGCGHGTQVAGIAAATGNNDLGGVGVAYAADLMPVRVMNAACSGSVSTIARGILFAVDNGADIINVSLNAQDSLFIPRALEYAAAHGVLVVAAAGNGGTYYDHGANMPPGSAHALVVGAVSHGNLLYGASNYGPHMVVAPAQGLRTTYLGGSFGGFSQTSAAAPVVAGVAALVKAAHADYSGAELCWAIKLSATDLGPPGQDLDFGWGKVNAAAALAQVLPEFLPPTCATGLEAPTYGWSHVIDTPGASATSARSIHSAAGVTAVAGAFTGTADFDPSAQEARVTSDGNGAQANGYLTVLSNGGSHLFTRVPIGSNADYGAAVAVAPGGGLVLASSFTQSVNFAGDQGNDTWSAQERAIAVSLWNGDGSYGRTFVLDSSNTDLAHDLAVDAAGNIYLVGLFRNTIDFDPGPATHNLTAKDPTGDGFLASYGPDGGFRFARAIGSTLQDVVTGVAVDADQVHIVGRRGATVDFDPGPAVDERAGSGGFLVTYTLDGAYVRVRDFAGPASPNDVVARTAQGLVVVGAFEGVVDFDDSAATALHASNGHSDVFAVAFDAQGAFAWSRTFGGSGQDVANEVSLAADGSLYVGGSFTGLVDFDPGIGFDERAAVGLKDAFISHLAADAEYLGTWARGSLNADEVSAIHVDEFDNLHFAASFGGPANLASAGPPDWIRRGAIYGQFFGESSRPEVAATTPYLAREAGPQTLHGLAHDTDSPIAGVHYSLDPGADDWRPCALVVGPAPNLFSCTVEIPADSPAGDLFLRAEDLAGNRTAPAAYARVPIVSGPTVVLDPVDSGPRLDVPPTLTGTASDADGSIAAVGIQVAGGDASWSACEPRDGAFDSSLEAFACPLPALGPGQHVVFIQATDNDGHVGGPYSVTFTILDPVDQTPPNVTLVDAVVGPIPSDSPSLSGLAESPTGIIQGVRYAVDGEDGSWMDCLAADGDFDSHQEAFTCTAGPLADGVHSIHIRATDGAGNTSPATVHFLLVDVAGALPAGAGGTALCPTSAVIVADRDTHIFGKAGLEDRNAGSASKLNAQSRATDKRHILVHFDLGAVPAGAVIDRARARVTVESGQKAGRTLSVRPLTQGVWVEGNGTEGGSACSGAGFGATWRAPNCSGLGTGWDGRGGSFGAGMPYGPELGTIAPAVDEAAYDVDVTEAARAWQADPEVNFGLVLLAVGSDEGLVKFHARTGSAGKQPSLLVDYRQPVAGGCSASFLAPATADSDIDEGAKTTWQGGSAKIKTQPAPAGQRRAGLLHFDLATIPPGAEITAATLHLNVTDSRPNHVDAVHALSSAWAEGTSSANGATWEDPDGLGQGGDWASQGGQFGTLDYAATVIGTLTPNSKGARTVDVRALVADWLARPSANLGLVLLATGTDTGEVGYSSRNDTVKGPQISGTWHLPPSDPERVTRLLVDRSTARDGEVVRLTLALENRSDLPVDDVTPSDFAVDRDGGAQATCAGPSPASQLVPAHASVYFTWNCGLSAGPEGGWLRFSSGAGGDGGATAWASAISHALAVRAGP